MTNPANYQLIATGPDRDLDTTACDVVVGDDVAIAAESVSFDAASSTATVDYTTELGTTMRTACWCARASRTRRGTHSSRTSR